MGAGRFQSSLELSPECNAKTDQGWIARIEGFQSSLELSPECNLRYRATAAG